MPDTLNEEVIKQEALTVIQQAQIVKITDQASYDVAEDLLLTKIKPFRKRWSEYWETVKAPAYAAYKAVQDKFNEGDKPLEAAERQVKAEILRWDTEQERIRQQQQREAEAKLRAEQEEEQMRAAAVAEETGATAEEVQAIVNAPIITVAPPVEKTYQKSSSVSFRDHYKCKVTDMKALCKAIGAGKVPVTYVLPNESVLNARAKADRETLNIPGCVVWNDKITSGRGR